MIEYSKKRKFGPVPYYPNVEKYTPPNALLQKPLIVAGPCSFGSLTELERVVDGMKDHGVNYLRCGVFKAGTYPRPGMGFGFIRQVDIAETYRLAHDYGMQMVLEVLSYDPESMALIDKYSDAYQVGARQMQNYTLLNVLARRKRPVFLKRNMGATLDEFLGAAEWILKENKSDVILIERGSSTFHNHVRWDLSISMIPAIKAINTNMPILVDASHGTGRSDLVIPMTLAGMAAGADGFMVEVHVEPSLSRSDAEQILTVEKFDELHRRVHDLLRLR